MFEEDDKDEFRFRWEIKKYSFATNKRGDPIKSPSFVAESLDNTKWFVSIFPRGEEEEEYVDICLTRCSNDGGGVEIAIVFIFELEAADSSRQERRESLKTTFRRNTKVGFRKFMKRSTLLEDMKSTFLPDDILTVHCTLERACSKVEYITEYICESYEETVKTEFPWIIKNWSEFNEVYKDVKFTGDHEVTLRMFICESNDADKNIILRLQNLEEEKKTIVVSCRTAILDTKGAEALSGITHHYLNETADVTTQELFKRAEMKPFYLQHDTLSLRCYLNMKKGKQTHKMTEKVRELTDVEDSEEYIRNELIRDYENLFLSGNFSDVKARAGSKVVSCHKNMFYARSTVLSDLVDKAEESSEDGVECVIDIKDLDGDTLEQMIYFLYTDKINNINPPKALKLFVAAHKYKIRYLKEKCALYLSNSFTFENVYDILIAAHIYEHGDLKCRAIHYISMYFSRICLTTEWANFRKTAKDVAAYACREIRRIKML